MLIVWCLVGAWHTCGVTYNLRRLIKPRNTSVWVISSLKGTNPISSQSQRMALIIAIGSLIQPLPRGGSNRRVRKSRNSWEEKLLLWGISPLPLLRCCVSWLQLQPSIRNSGWKCSVHTLVDMLRTSLQAGPFFTYV